MNINHAKRQEICEGLESIAEQMTALLEEARDLVREHPSYRNWDAYAFRNLEEHIENANPYNQSLHSIIERLNVDEAKKHCELVEEWGEYWEEEDE